MLPLRQNVPYNKHLFFKDICIVVLVGHGILLALLIFYDTGKFNQERFVLHDNKYHSTVVFMPLKKRVLNTNSAVENSSVSNDLKVINYQQYEKKAIKQEKPSKKKKIAEPVVKKEIVKTPKKVVQKKEQKPATTIKTDTKKKSDKKKHEKVDLKKDEPIKVLEKPVLQEKKDEPAPVKPEVKKEVVQPVVEKKVEEPVIVPEEKQSVQSQQARQSVQEKIVPAQEFSEPVSFVGSYDLEIIQMKQQIQEQVALYYKPPVGIGKKLICELTVLIGPHGKAETVTIKKRSGNIANDVCARAALLKVTFPKQVIGKEIIIELGQS